MPDLRSGGGGDCFLHITAQQGLTASPDGSSWWAWKLRWNSFLGQAWPGGLMLHLIELYRERRHRYNQKFKLFSFVENSVLENINKIENSTKPTVAV